MGACAAGRLESEQTNKPIYESASLAPDAAFGPVAASLAPVCAQVRRRPSRVATATDAAFFRTYLAGPLLGSRCGMRMRVHGMLPPHWGGSVSAIASPVWSRLGVHWAAGVRGVAVRHLWVRRIRGLLAIGVGRAWLCNGRIYLSTIVRIVGSWGLMVCPILLVLGHRRTVLLLLSHTCCPCGVGWVVCARQLRLVQRTGAYRSRVNAVRRGGSRRRCVVDLLLNGILRGGCVRGRRGFRAVVAEVAGVRRWQTCLRVIAGPSVHMALGCERGCRRGLWSCRVSMVNVGVMLRLTWLGVHATLGTDGRFFIRARCLPEAGGGDVASEQTCQNREA